MKKYVRVLNATRQKDLGQKIRIAATLMDRAIGLLGTPELSAGEGVWLSPCRSVHTFFMRYPIDILFVDSDGAVLAQQNLAPWRLSGWHRRCSGVLELPSGTLRETGTRPGDRLEMKEIR